MNIFIPRGMNINDKISFYEDYILKLRKRIGNRYFFIQYQEIEKLELCIMECKRRIKNLKRNPKNN